MRVRRLRRCYLSRQMTRVVVTLRTRTLCYWSFINASGPCVLFASPGMISGGFSLEAFKQWAPSEKNLIALPGFDLGYWVRAIYVWLQNIDNGSLCCDGSYSQV
ncbi:hypothetical protein Scep_028116 [Stephania cephalantha]|uniref:Beta-Casp domain-containing protein n=1 Tax=Stephania cephalantha TaxID=152367 RepID=A0AAP0EHP6_9MAGN